ncbi:MAG TPA: hypothetical protein VEX63_14375 [Flavisolibacter sp.]|jgi:hypothetical protein|nr:hypothetical protein [Flavisolibacter sp.]HZI02332.1 hypothetical protein [Flavisolibacter sp.]
MEPNKANINYQDGPHQEGQQNNTNPAGNNVTHSHREMMNDSEEQKAGNDHQGKESQRGADQDAGGQLGNSSGSKK